MDWLTTKARTFLGQEDGVTAIEYALIASLIAIVIVLAVTGVGQRLVAIFTDVSDAFP
jgi:pilus assembly protein Flp/PilA